MNHTAPHHESRATEPADRDTEHRERPTLEHSEHHPRPGIDVPDGRGRTGLDQIGLDLNGNPRVRVRSVELLSSSWYVLRRTRLELRSPDGSWTEQHRETYDRGDGAAILLHDPERRTVLLVRQFRYPAYVNGHPTGDLLEVPAGLLDTDSPETAIRREAQEETGLTIEQVQPIHQLYMSPGSVTERIHFFLGRYHSGEQGSWAGVADEGEHTELVELNFDVALGQIGTGIVDGKTALLLYWAAVSGPFRR